MYNHLIVKEAEKENLNGDELWLIYNNCSWPVCSVSEIESVFKYANDLGIKVTNLAELIVVVKHTIRGMINDKFVPVITKEYMNRVYSEVRPLFNSPNYPIVSNFRNIGNISELEELVTLVFAAETSILSDEERRNFINNKDEYLLKTGLYPIFIETKSYIYGASCGEDYEINI